ncbi:ABC-2 type transport system permease protein [Cellulosimicrobium aquatile]|uniref:Transport permease protein n=2 Tax=Cellulosimicrobium TaxID=157920 RepID=A0A4Y8R290_9MICO|nr:MULTISPECIES: ABC transporter permease [Cellulosimicrobium]TGA72973.1 ABC transporter permease [Cellulosimicrobium terreum]MCM3534321.1 ABC transporter permease [Cellulosimicrobium funkei]MDQ8042451.1 ABC transporter permease [Cellulosimicrobium sp. XJ-DQ-B-000]NMF28380.1 ABC transporter permease [Cellulosimicrobium aquatile]TFF08581.1 ABC transporter permease [Cellulosimicrobium funkei]
MSTAAAEERPLVEPGRGHGLLDVVRHRFLLRLVVKKELRVRYRGSVLGMLWSYVKPAVQFIVFYLALGLFLGLSKGVEDYAVYLFSGIVVVNFFGEGFSNATRSVVGNAALVRKIYLPRELFPVSSLWVSAVHFFPQLLVLLVGAILFGWRPNAAELGAGLLGFCIVAVLALGLGLLFGAVNVFYRDAENFVDLIVMVATWLSPVLYPWQAVRDVVPEWLFVVYQLNPLTAAVELFHYAFWYPGTTSGTVEMPPHLWLFAVAGLVISLLVLFAGQSVFKRLEGRFAQEL